MSGRSWLALIVFSIVLLIVALCIHPVRAHDHNRPELNEWMAKLHSKGGAWCCNGDDNDPIDDVDNKAKGGGFRVKYQGKWYDVPPEAIVEGPNKSGGPILWMYKGWGDVKPRCFMAGPLT